MRVHYFTLFFLFSTLGIAAPEIKLVGEPKSLEDFEHHNKGCPANSECDQVMGHQLQRWQDLTKNLKSSETSHANKALALEAFREKSGIPVEFYTYKKSQQGFRPLYFNSPCKEHNPKLEEKRVLRGIAFVRSIQKDKALVWRDQAQIEVPVGELFIPQPVRVYFPSLQPTVAGAPDQGGSIDYQIPIDDQPLFIRDKSLHIVREEDDYFFMLKITPAGDWSIVDSDFTRLSEWEMKREYVPCPEDKEKKTPKEFGVTFCKSIWNEDIQKPVVIRLHSGCNA